MQYILSEEEMAEFKRLQKMSKSLPSPDVLQAMCTKIADEWPTWTGWDNKNTENPEPWGCVITLEKEGVEWYCDNCPVQCICPLENKSWSK